MHIPSAGHSANGSENPIDVFLNQLGAEVFSDVMEDVSKGKQQVAIVEIGPLSYKVIPESSSDASLKPEKSVDTEKQTFSDNGKDNDAGPLPIPFVASQWQIIPLQTDTFITQLPTHLSEFIQRVATVIQRYHNDTGQVNVRFHFKSLNISVHIERADESMKIALSFSDPSLHQMFDEATQLQLKRYLEQQLNMENLDLVYDYVSDAQKQGTSDKEGSNGSDAEDVAEEMEDDVFED